jgi:hypothetical protein
VPPCQVLLILRRDGGAEGQIRSMGDRLRQQPPVPTPPSLGGLDATGNTPHAQFLATEHWSLLATRSMTWNEIFSRTGTYLTVLSAAVIALSLVANATGFGQAFRTFALLILPVVLLIGVGTFFRLVEADIEDAWLVIGMNPLLHAYLELAPELEPTLSQAITTTRRACCRPTASAVGLA